VVETALQINEESKRFCPDDFLALDGYQMFRQDNTKEKKGGIIVYVKDDILVGRNKDINNMSADFAESIWLELEKSGEKIMFGTVYRKGKSGAANNKKLLEIMTKASRVYNKIVICGDLNFPEIDWGSLQVKAGPLSAPAQFVDCVLDNYLTQHVSNNTRARGTDKPSLIDLIITENSQQLTDSIQHSDPIGKSDHCVLKWKYLVSVEEPPDAPERESKTRYNVNKGNYKELDSALSAIDWDKDLKKPSLDEILESFYEIVDTNVKEWVPPMGNKVFKRSKPPWLNKSARKEIKNKRCAWNRYTRSKSYAKYLSYTKARNKAAKTIKRAKKEFEKKLAKECKTNPKAFHKYANFKSKSNKKVIRLRDKEGNVQLKDEANAKTLNEYFTSVFTKEDDADVLIMNEAAEQLYGSPPNDPFNYVGPTANEFLDVDSIDCSEEVVKALLKDINPNKSNIDECIHPRILKECANSLAKPISIIYRRSLDSGTVPSLWKDGTVTPLHKGGSRHDACQFRPVTITSLLCRILEKIVKKSWVSHLNNLDFLTDDQHGFREKRSCLSNLLMNLEEITKLIDKGSIVDQIYLDFQKAFDKVPHQRLLYKLRKAGIKGTMLSWIESFLTGRRQRVKVNGVYSFWSWVLSSVPQGSVLGPLLFILFINDLPGLIRCLCMIFADDTKLTKKVDTLEEVDELQEDLNSLHEWTKEWQLKFNAKKCHVIHFGKKNPHSLYHINGTLVTEVNQERDLGVVISDTLTAHQNVLACVKKANQTLGMIRRTFSYLDEEMLSHLIKVFIRPHLEYCQQAMSPIMVKDINLIEKVHRRATRLLPHLEVLEYEERLSVLNLYSMEQRRQRGDLILMYRIMTDDLMIDKTKLFTMDGDSKTRGHGLKVKMTENVKLDVRKYFFTNRIVEPWNELPQDIVDSITVNEFKGKYDRWLGIVA